MKLFPSNMQRMLNKDLTRIKQVKERLCSPGEMIKDETFCYFILTLFKAQE